MLSFSDLNRAVRAARTMPEVDRIRLLRIWPGLFERCGEFERRRRALQDRLDLRRRVAQCAAAGPTMRVVEAGRDCDGVAYSGVIRTIPATVAAFDDLHDRIAHWADGPFSLGVLPPDAPDPEYESRDLALEAFEDGHPHLLRP